MGKSQEEKLAVACGTGYVSLQPELKEQGKNPFSLLIYGTDSKFRNSLKAKFVMRPLWIPNWHSPSMKRPLRMRAVVNPMSVYKRIWS